MAINVSFAGATIYRPGAYSKTTIDVGGGFPVGPAGLIAVIGEADAGEPGSAEVDIRNNRYSADQLPAIRAKYRTGPIVDAASFLFAPAADAAIPSGAQTVWFYKTNASVRAQIALGSYGTVRAQEWGIGGNRITAEVISIAEVGPAVNGVVVPAFGVALNGATFDVIVNGVKHTVTLSTTPADHADIATLVTEISAQLTGFAVVTAGTPANSLNIALAADALAYQKGWAKSIELAGAGLALVGLTAGMSKSSAEAMATIRIQQPRDLISEEETVGGNVVLEIGYNAAATVSVSATALTLTPGVGSPVSFQLANYATLKELAADVALVPGWTVAVSDAQYNQLSPDVLDQVTAVGAYSPTGMAAMIKKDAAEVQAMFDGSQLVDLVNPAMVGLPAAFTKANLAGGLKGATTSLEIVNALEKFTKFQVNFIVPLFSRDASADVSDGLTESGSTYTIAGIHQAVKTHISLMKSVKKRSERQGYLSYKASFDACKTQAGVLADERLQLMIQDIRQVDSLGNIKWFQPWAFAALLAGARAGASIGEPMTYKFLNASGIRHTAQPMSTAEADIVLDFDPDTMTDEAIQAGITFMEARQTGGFRVVVDNTTYGKDGNFVFNRGNVMYAADIVAFNFRQQMEDVYVGRKNTVTNGEVAATAASILNQFQAQGITVGTADAPTGYKNLAVRIEGNTIYVDVVIKIVEGIDFILENITIQRAQQ